VGTIINPCRQRLANCRAIGHHDYFNINNNISITVVDVVVVAAVIIY